MSELFLSSACFVQKIPKRGRRPRKKPKISKVISDTSADQGNSSSLATFSSTPSSSSARKRKAGECLKDDDIKVKVPRKSTVDHDKADSVADKLNEFVATSSGNMLLENEKTNERSADASLGGNATYGDDFKEKSNSPNDQPADNRNDDSTKKNDSRTGWLVPAVTPKRGPGPVKRCLTKVYLGASAGLPGSVDNQIKVDNCSESGIELSHSNSSPTCLNRCNVGDGDDGKGNFNDQSEHRMVGRSAVEGKRLKLNAKSKTAVAFADSNCASEVVADPHTIVDTSPTPHESANGKDTDTVREDTNERSHTGEDSPQNSQPRKMIGRESWIKSNSGEYDWLVPIAAISRKKSKVWEYFDVYEARGGVAGDDGRMKVVRCRVKGCGKELLHSTSYSLSIANMRNHIQTMHTRKICRKRRGRTTNKCAAKHECDLDEVQSKTSDASNDSDFMVSVDGEGGSECQSSPVTPAYLIDKNSARATDRTTTNEDNTPKKQCTNEEGDAQSNEQPGQEHWLRSASDEYDWLVPIFADFVRRSRVWLYFGLYEARGGLAGSDGQIRVVRCHMKGCGKEFVFDNKSVTNRMLAHIRSVHESKTYRAESSSATTRVQQTESINANVKPVELSSGITNGPRLSENATNSIKWNILDTCMDSSSRDNVVDERNEAVVDSTKMLDELRNKSDDDANGNSRLDEQQPAEESDNQKDGSANSTERKNWIKSTGFKYEWLIPITTNVRKRSKVWDYFDLYEARGGMARKDGQTQVLRCRIEGCGKEVSVGTSGYWSGFKSTLAHIRTVHEAFPRENNQKQGGYPMARFKSRKPDPFVDLDFGDSIIDDQCEDTASCSNELIGGYCRGGDGDGDAAIMDDNIDLKQSESSKEHKNWIKSVGDKYEWLIPVFPFFPRRHKIWNYFYFCEAYGGIAREDGETKVALCRIKGCGQEFECGKEQHSYVSAMLKHVHLNHSDQLPSSINDQIRQHNKRTPHKVLIAYHRSDMLMPLMITAAEADEDGEARCYAWARIYSNQRVTFKERYKCVGCTRIHRLRIKRFIVPKLVISYGGIGKISIPEREKHYCKPEKCANYCDFRVFDLKTSHAVEASTEANKKDLHKEEDFILRRSQLSAKVRECLSNEVAATDSVIEVAIDDDLRFVKLVRAKWDAINANVNSEDSWRLISDAYIENGWEWRSKQLPRERWESIVKGVEAKRKSFVSRRDFSKCERIAELIMLRSKDEKTNEVMQTTKTTCLADLIEGIHHEGNAQQTRIEGDDNILYSSIRRKHIQRNRTKEAIFMRLVRNEWPTLSTANIYDQQGRSQLRAAWQRIDNAQRAALGPTRKNASFYWNFLCALYTDDIRARSSHDVNWVPDEAEMIFTYFLCDADDAIRINGRYIDAEDLRMVLRYLIDNHSDFVTRTWDPIELQCVFDRIADTLPLNACTRERLLHIHVGYSIIIGFLHKTMLRWNRYGGESFLAVFNDIERLALQLSGVNVSVMFRDVGNYEHKLGALTATEEGSVRFVKLIYEYRHSLLLYIPIAEPWQIIHDVYRANGWQWIWRSNPARRWHNTILNVRNKKKMQERGDNWVMSECESIVMDKLYDEDKLIKRMRLDGSFSRKFSQMLAYLGRSVLKFFTLDEDGCKQKLKEAASRFGLDDAAHETIIENSTHLLSTLLSTAKRGLATGRVLTELEHNILKLYHISVNDLNANDMNILPSIVRNNSVCGQEEVMKSIVKEEPPDEDNFGYMSSSIQRAKDEYSVDSKSGLMAEYLHMNKRASSNGVCSSGDENDFDEDSGSSVHGDFYMISDDDDDDPYDGCSCDGDTGEGWRALVPKEEFDENDMIVPEKRIDTVDAGNGRSCEGIVDFGLRLQNRPIKQEIEMEEGYGVNGNADGRLNQMKKL